jgi:hypothetical protein
VRLVLAVLLVGAAGPARAQVTETQHAFDTTFSLSPRLDAIMHSRIRTRPSGGGFYQARAGPIFDFDLTRRVALLGGYYFTRQTGSVQWHTVHRPFGGFEVALIAARLYTADARVLAERFLSAGEPDFARYRQRVRVRTRLFLSPYTSVEWFQDRHGLRSVRYSGGVRLQPIPRVNMDMGYFYETRRPELGGDRHMFLTTFHILRPGRRPDPDV